MNRNGKGNNGRQQSSQGPDTFANDQSVLQKGLPCNIDAERFILGSVLLDDSRFVEIAGALQMGDFMLEKHRRIYSRMIELHEAGEKIDRVTLANQLLRYNELESVDGLTYLVSLDDGLPHIANLDSYIRIIRDKAALRRIALASQNLLNRALIGEETPSEILAGAEEALTRIGDSNTSKGMMTPLEVIQKAGGLNAFLDPARREKGLSTGFTRLDEMTNGLHKGELIIIAARPSMGKTAFALNICWQVATRLFQPVAIFSLEMSQESLLTRMLCAAARVDSQRFRAGYLNETERGKLRAAANQMVEAPIFIDDTAGVTLMDMHAKLRRIVASGQKLGLVIVDYLQLMSGRGKAENRNQEISQISRGLKLLSKELGCPFLVLSQLSRAVESRSGDHRPQLADLRDSGCVAGETRIPIADKGIYAPISSLVGIAGLKVWALNERTQRSEMVDARAFKSGRKQLLLMTTRLGKQIRATANHKFLTVDGWMPLRNIGKGHRIALPRVMSPELEQSLPEAELAFLAHMIGNGTTLPRQPIHYVSGDPILAEYVCMYARQIWGDSVKTRWQKSKAGNWWESFFSSTRRTSRNFHSPVVEWCKAMGLYGKRAPEKRVPAIVFAQPDEQVAFFLRHLWSTDGCYSGPAPYYSTTSEPLARGVQSLLLRMGVTGILRPKDEGIHRQSWVVHVSGRDDVMRFLNTVGAIGTFRIAAAKRLRQETEGLDSNTNRDVIPASIWQSRILPVCERLGYTQRGFQSAIGNAYIGTSLYLQNLGRERLGRIAEALDSDELRTMATSDVYWDEVTEIVEDEMDDVFDIEVPSHHNFVAADIFVHNSIEQDADLVGFLFREEIYKRDREDLRGLAELIIAKQRQGPIGKVDLVFLHALTKFENRAEDLGDLPLEDYPRNGNGDY